MNPSPRQPYVPSFISPPQQSSNGFNLNNKVSPSILLIIIILAVVFFISGLLHLLVRFLLRPPNRDPDDMDNDVTALQGQLQQLFHLHDSGVDQSFIDALPVFNYKAVVGVKDPFDCAVCLCEFEAEDKLRLLPKCSHAFHVDCIDTWLLSHSTCPLCRASLLGEFNGNYSSFSPVVLLLESGSERSGEIVSDREVARVSSCLSSEDLRQVCVDVGVKSCGEVQEKDGEGLKKGCSNEEVVLSVKLGKFRSVDNGGGEGSGTIEDDGGGGGDARRCFSMGSFAYVMDESSLLQVPVRTSPKMMKHSSKKRAGHRVAMSECGCDSRRELFNGFEAFRVLEVPGDHHGSEDSGKGTVIGRSGGGISSSKESFSVSKIWLRGKKDRSSGAAVERDRRAFSFRFPMGPSESKGESGRRAMPEIDVVGLKGEDGRRAISEIGVMGRDNRPNGAAVEVKPERRAFSFRFPMSRDPLGTGESKGKKGRRTISEFDVSRWEDGGVGRGFNEDVESCNSLDSQANAPSFARRTLLWMMGRQQNKVVHSSFPSNV